MKIKQIMATQIKRQNEIGSKQWGIYINGKLVEGGFFSRDKAVDVAIKDYEYGRVVFTNSTVRA